MIYEWFKYNWPLLPGIILILYSRRHCKYKIWWWASFDDKYTAAGGILFIMGIILIFVGIWIKLFYLI
jgi:hypothetical protein